LLRPVFELLPRLADPLLAPARLPLLLLRPLALLRLLERSARPPVLALRAAGFSAGSLRRPPPLARARALSGWERLFCALRGVLALGFSERLRPEEEAEGELRLEEVELELRDAIDGLL
jgi:hypothetical protein